MEEFCSLVLVWVFIKSIWVSSYLITSLSNNGTFQWKRFFTNLKTVLKKISMKKPTHNKSNRLLISKKSTCCIDTACLSPKHDEQHKSINKKPSMADKWKVMIVVFCRDSIDEHFKQKRLQWLAETCRTSRKK